MTLDVTTLSDDELDEARRAISAEQLLRRKLDASPEKIAHVLHEYQEAHGIGQGEEWQFPTSALKVYGEGAEVTHEGEVWVSTHSGNAHMPGQSGWRRKPVEDEEGRVVPPPFVPPSGAHDAYQAGERITWDGLVYEAARDAVVHSPADYAPDWVLVEAEPEPEPEPEPDEGEPVEPEPEPAPEPEEPAVAEWEVGKSYLIGDELTYQGVRYRLIQNHTSAAHWPPDQVASIYEVI